MPVSPKSTVSTDVLYTEEQSGRKKTVLDVVDTTVSRCAVYVFCVVLICVAYRSYVGSLTKPFWYDEIFSIIVATQPSWHAMKEAMVGDGNPPLYALLIRALMHLSRESRFLIRLPSLVGFVGALIGIFVFVRRECGAAYGLLAVAFVCSEPVWTYSYEARPYGLLLGFMMLGLVSWQSATRAGDSTRPRRLGLCGMAVAIAGSILAHNIGVIEVGVPLLFGEAVRMWRTRRVDWPVLATGMAAIPALLVTIPMMRRTSELLFNYTRSPLHALTVRKIFLDSNAVHSLPLVFDISHSSVEFTVLLLGIMMVPFAYRLSMDSFNRRTPTSSGAVETKMPPHIIAGATGASLLIPITWVLMMCQNGWYFARYGIGSVAGIAILVCFGARKSFGTRSVVPLTVTMFLLAEYCYPAVHLYRHPPDRVSANFAIYADQSDLPVAAVEPLAFPVVWWYAPKPVQDRLVYLKDIEFAKNARYANNVAVALPEAALASEDHRFPAHFQDYASFVAAHDHFILYLPTLAINPAIEEDRFRSAGFVVTPIRQVGSEKIDDVQRVRRNASRD